ncbi:hypothetical protein KAR91_51070 [Candidatus Pacearchaeota archaeon]|nr:hypothetical protein [Candidatus Pacearchaeota archaeon]
MSLKTYDPSEVSLAVSGKLIAFDDVKCGYIEDRNTVTAGTQGEVTRTINLNKIINWTILLPQTHGDNDVMAALAITNQAFVMGMRDANGTMVATSPEAVITKRPEIGRAKESAQNEWIIQGKGEIFEGGNS